MSKIIGICNCHDCPSLGELTANRPLGTVTFLGRYAIMDFVLSNFSNSGINIMPILVENGVGLIRSHIRDGNIWINNTKIGFIRLLLNEKMLNNPNLNTDVNNILTNMSLLHGLDCDYIIVAAPYFLYSFNFKDLIHSIESNGADVLMLYSSRNDADKEFLNCDSLTLSGNKVVDMKKNTGHNKMQDISLGAYIFKTSTFIEMVSSSHEISAFYSLKDLLAVAIKEKRYNIQGYKFTGYVAPILSLEGYVHQSFSLLEYKNRQKLFLKDWPIYTTSHNTPPALYKENAEVENSFIANGSIINGKVKNSILSRGVVVEKGAEINNSIIFTHTVVGEQSKLNYVVADKSVRIGKVNVLNGHKDELIVIPTGVKI